MLQFLKRALLGLFAVIGFFTFVLLTSIVISLSFFGDGGAQRVSSSDNIILTVNLDEEFTEGSSSSRIEGFSLAAQTTLKDVVVAIRNAGTDPRVVALKANLSQQAAGLAQIQDIRDAVAEFRSSGKPTFVYSETIGEGIGALPAYYMASAFEEIWVQPSGTVGVAGIGTEQPFLADFLERYGVKGSFIQRKEYKSAGETLSNSEMSPANREATRALLKSWFDQIVSGIAETRDLPETLVTALIDQGPLLSKEALDGGLVDHLGYRDEFETTVAVDFGSADSFSIREYIDLEPMDDVSEPEKQIAIIHAVGEITRGGDDSSFFPEPGVRSASMSKAIRDAANSEDIDALLIRVDSPGGSYVASDTIWREIKNAKAKAKPVVVSMGNTAASGGYYIAMPADRIFAQPATVTGSIGVIFGKIVFGGAAEQLGINFDRISFGESAGLFSSLTDFDRNELARLNQMIDATYADFTTKAASDRGMSVDELERVARGRVWSGTDALEVGLIDELGGLGKAIDYTKAQIGLSADDPVWLTPFPPPEDPFTAFLSALEEGQIPFGVLTLAKAAVWADETFSPVLTKIEAAQRPGMRAYMAPIVVR